MGKGTNFIGQPLLTQLLKFFDKDKILRMSRKCGGERYVKSFDGWHHLVVMLYAVLMRFDSLREITASMLAEARKLNHLGITTMPRRSTLSDANARHTRLFQRRVIDDVAARLLRFLCMLLAEDGEEADTHAQKQSAPVHRLTAHHAVVAVLARLHQRDHFLPHLQGRDRSLAQRVAGTV